MITCILGDILKSMSNKFVKILYNLCVIHLNLPKIKKLDWSESGFYFTVYGRNNI